MPSAPAQAERPAGFPALAVHACAGPRYASYPAPDSFGTRFRAADALRELRRRGEAAGARPLAIDLHPPLRDAHAAGDALHDRDTLERYLGCIEREIVTARGAIGRDELVERVRCGAGGPVPLGTEDVARLMEGLRSYFALAPECDCLVEVEAHCTSLRGLEALSALGFTAVTLVVVKSGAERLAAAEAALAQARAAGFGRVELEWLGRMRRGSAEAAALGAMLALRPAMLTIDAASDAETFAAVLQALDEAGYRCVAMDRYATAESDVSPRAGPDGAAGDVLAFGAAAVSSIGETCSQDHAGVEPYCASLDRGELPVWRGVALDRDALARREVIRALACDFAVDLEAFAQRFGAGFGDCFAGERARLDALVRDGVLERDARTLRVREAARPLVRVACRVFDRAAAPSP